MPMANAMIMKLPDIIVFLNENQALWVLNYRTYSSFLCNGAQTHLRTVTFACSSTPSASTSVSSMQVLAARSPSTSSSDGMAYEEMRRKYVTSWLPSDCGFALQATLVYLCDISSWRFLRANSRSLERVSASRICERTVETSECLRFCCTFYEFKNIISLLEVDIMDVRKC